MRIGGGFLFKPGSAAVEAQALPLLDKLVHVVLQSDAKVIVEGHTDNVPIHSDVYPSNWELAGARAGAVVRALQAGGIPAFRLQGEAFADSRPRAPNATEDGRRKNRRVEILIRTEQ